MSIAPTQAELDAMQASTQDPDIARANDAMLADDFVSAERFLRSALQRRPNGFVACACWAKLPPRRGS